MKSREDKMVAQTSFLHFAIANSLVGFVRLLIEAGENVNARDSKRKTPIMLCAILPKEYHSMGMARMLLQAGANVGLTDSKKRNAFMYAIIFQKPTLVSLLTEALDFPINQRDVDGNTSLHHALDTGNYKIIKSIINEFTKRNISLDDVNKRGESAMEKALRMGQVDVINSLVKNGSQISKINKISMTRFNEPLGPKESLCFTMKIILESCKAHKSSTQFNIHQFRRQIMAKYKQAKDCDVIETSIKPLDRGYFSTPSPEGSIQSSLVDEPNQKIKKEKESARRSWRSDIMKVWDVYRDQVSVAYRPTVKTTAQTNEEAMRILQPETDTQTEVSEDENFRPSKALLSRRRNTVAYKKTTQPLNKSRTRSLGNIEMLHDAAKARNGLYSDDHSSSNSSETLKRKKRKSIPKTDAMSDSGSSSSNSSVNVKRRQSIPKIDPTKSIKNRPTSAVRDGKIAGKLPAIKEVGKSDANPKPPVNSSTSDTSAKTPPQLDQIQSDKDGNKTNIAADSFNKASAPIISMSPVKTTRRIEAIRTITSDNALSDISEEGSVASEYVERPNQQKISNKDRPMTAKHRK